MNDRGDLLVIIPVAFVIFMIIYVGFFYLPTYNHWIIENEIREQITIIEPYDVIDSVFVWEHGHGWWTASIWCMDVETGNTSWDSIRYNEQTNLIVNEHDDWRGIEPKY